VAAGAAPDPAKHEGEHVKQAGAALCALGALVFAGGASADPLRYGIGDDWPASHPCGDVFWTSMSDIAYTDLRLTVRWQGGDTILNQSEVAGAIACAALNGVRPILAIYPKDPAAIGNSGSQQDAFASFVATVGTTFPDVKNFIVGNEPNRSRFWQPQFRGSAPAAAADYTDTLAKSYDALKAVRPDSVVWGPAISSRGNDNPNRDPSTSPVRFIKYMGAEYRRLGRWQPLFDEFDLHPYPKAQDTVSYSARFEWPNAGAADMDRIKQTVWDAFHGTWQPVFSEQGSGKSALFAAPQSLPANFSEVGSQTMIAGHEDAYDGSGENISSIGEARQARYHTELMEIAACDPALSTLLFFPLIDEAFVSSGFQSGNLFADLEQKQSYGAVKGKIASSGGYCSGAQTGWKHTEAVLSPKAQLVVKGGARYLQVSANENVTASGQITFRYKQAPAKKGKRKLTEVAVTKTVTQSFALRSAGRMLTLKLKGPRAGKVIGTKVSVTLTSETNPDRKSTLGV
jgi:hypothetical protein